MGDMPLFYTKNPVYARCRHGRIDLQLNPNPLRRNNKNHGNAAIRHPHMVPMRLLMLSLLTAWSMAAQAQSAMLGWLSHPDADSTSAVWFCHTFLTKQRPLQGMISVASTGRIKLFVNESNLSTAVPTASTAQAHSVEVNITPYLRPDSNTIAILYTPLPESDPTRQVAVDFYGRNRQGQAFAHLSDGEWLCRTAGICRTDSGFQHHCNASIDEGYTQQIATACWLPARLAATSTPFWLPSTSKEHTGLKAVRMVRPRYFDLTRTGVDYEFGTGFYGYLRITLRGTKPGSIISVDNHRFWLAGTTDEQISTSANPTFVRRISISGDTHFAPSQIQCVEGIALALTPPLP